MLRKLFLKKHSLSNLATTIITLAFIVSGCLLWGERGLSIDASSILAILSIAVFWKNGGLNRPTTPSPTFIFSAGLFFTIVLLLLPLFPFYYLVAAFFGLYLAEANFGRQGLFPHLILLASSPFVSYASQIFGFPIRLQLSELASKLLSIADATTYSIGNGIYWKGQVFWVDEACIGLQLVGVGTVLSLVILWRHSLTKGIRFHYRVIGAYLVLTLGLLLWTNLSRLMSIVVLRASTEGLTHQALGLISLALHTLIPLYFLSMYLANKAWAVKKASELNITTSSHKKAYFTIALLSLGISSFAPLFFSQNSIAHTDVPASLQPHGMEPQFVENGIWQSQDTKQGLWYWKGPLLPYRSEHSPMICWRGSGYKLRNIQLGRNADGAVVYTGELQKGSTTLQTSWWYECPNTGQTYISQWQWRLHALLTGDEFWLVNVTN